MYISFYKTFNIYYRYDYLDMAFFKSTGKATLCTYICLKTHKYLTHYKAYMIMFYSSRTCRYLGFFFRFLE